MQRTPPLQSKKKVRQRSIWLLALLVVAASISYPQPANWVLAKIQKVVGINLGQIDKPFVLGLDLQGGTHLEYEADVSRVTDSDRREALNGVRDVIERRVNTLGVSEPLIQTTQAGDSWRVTVELAGIPDVNQAVKLIGETPILEFKEQDENAATATSTAITAEQKAQLEGINATVRQEAEAVLAEAIKPETDFAKLATEKTQNTLLKDKGGDLGFIYGQPEHQDIYNEAKSLATGTVIGRLLEREGEFMIAKVTEVKSQPEINAHHLLIAYQGAERSTSTLTKVQAKAKIDGIKRTATVKNFDALVKQHSNEPGAKESAGDLGWFGRGVWAESFENAVFAQQVGTISEVVETPFGYHLIWKIAERPVTDVRVSLIEFKRFTEADVPRPDNSWKSTKLTGRQLTSARVSFDQQSGGVQVALQFNDEGADLFAEITKRNIGKPVAIFLDGEIISQPTVQAEIIGGQAVITGQGDVNEAKILARRLQAGALPVPIKLIAQQTVGPSLGSDSLLRSLRAGIVGFILVAIFMILLYRLPGIVSIIALALYAALVAAVFKLIPVTMTLAGIAGFILSIGIAVDANILVFERLKEELAEGKPLSQAVEEAFRRAWLSIRDGHLTVLISCAVLYWFSSSIIRGFALTLAIGITLSLFTAVVSTRTILRLLVMTKLADYGWLFLKPSNKR